MSKMRLDYILSSDSKSSKDDRGAERQTNVETTPHSVDYIAPRSASDERPRPVRPSERVGESNSSQHIRMHGGSSSRPSSREPSRTGFKGKKGRTPTSPSATRGHSSAEVRPHACPSCDRSFYKLEQLKRHDRLVHLNIRPFVCTTCDLSFGTAQNMQVHLKTRKHKLRLETLRASEKGSQAGSSRRQPP